ncbi:hypothetical protein ACLMAJ_18245 [Nocardia sp. KC 131]
MVDRLERRGFLARETDPADRAHRQHRKPLPPWPGRSIRDQ